jgi:hypothetical protein
MQTDYFESMLKTLKLTPDEQQLIVEKRKGQCICDICPTYRECAGNAGDERAFCTVGGSACIGREIECLCSTCPLSREMHLRYSYYCTRGSENRQHVMDVLGLE